MDERECERCEGCGKVANTDEGEPWTAWTSLPLHSSHAVLMGLVRPIPCPACGGTGKAGALRAAFEDASERADGAA